MSDDRYDDAFCKELADIGLRAIAFVEAECRKASKPCGAPDVSMVLQSAIIDHLEADYTKEAHPTKTHAEILRGCAPTLRMIGENLIQHADKLAKRANS